MNINRYPGHMEKTKKDIKNSLNLVDIVAEIIDSRIPISSSNPLLKEITGSKPRIILMNKADLADQLENKKWIKFFKEKGINAVEVNSKKNIDTDLIYKMSKEQLKEEFQIRERKGIENKKIKMMVVGIPNSGKSTFINNISNRKGTNTGNRPGITKQKQWIRTKSNLDLLDTPGVLWPKFESEEIGLHLSYTHAIKDEIIDIETLCLKFISEIQKIDTNIFKDRYKIETKNMTDIEIFEEIAKKRGCLIKNGIYDYTKCANLIFQDFRTGKLGRITLEKYDLFKI
ncbi:MAG: ribosome biogenesis GTPase YlqF [Peptoniphilaceae bacterium]|nr:ribosome biogenesis GTPase YlqF [Peptoniphilaceae bacterium]MDD7383148.1 ribosome biogenesis GTPase YlqF [Peptoniphilaceae bacterium]MDY3738121.1 ribosome biogenesis GTPase YlqF [Peptoniphilaceae bacterium]